MPDQTEPTESSKSKEAPLIFISHDSRDADLAEAFSKLLKSVSAGMLKSFRSSDRKGNEGIEFGDEWYKTLMSKLDKASDVVCLLTERSLGRPWILYEAGVAKGKLGTPVHGLALGVPLTRVSTGPFYQFQNSDDSEESLAKLVLQICRRIPNLDPDEDVVAGQVKVFKQSVADTLNALGSGQKRPEKEEAVKESAVAKVLEEMKLIVRDLSVKSEMQFEIMERRRFKRSLGRDLHPGMIEEMAHMLSRRVEDPIGILIIASLVRDDFPWLYELGLEAYRTAKRGNSERASEALRRFRDAAEFSVHGPISELRPEGRDNDWLHRLPELIHRFVEKYERMPLAVRVPVRKRTIDDKLKVKKGEWRLLSRRCRSDVKRVDERF